MINDNKYELRSRIQEMLTSEEWLVCLFSAIPNIFTDDLLVWCLRDKLNIETIKDSILKLVELDFIYQQYNKENICFFTMHERFRQIMNDKNNAYYITFCKKLIDYYDDYIAKDKVFSKQYYNDKLFNQLILKDNTEWRRCHQYIFEKGDYFECEKMLYIYQKALMPSDGLFYAWYQYYKLQSEIINYKIGILEELTLNYSPISNIEFYIYWSNICGVLYAKNGKYKEAEKYFVDALAYADNVFESCIIQYNLCVIYFYMQQYIKAYKLMSQISDVINSDDLFFLIKYKFLLAVINKSIYKLDTALMQFEEVIKLKEIYQAQLKTSYPLYLCAKQPRPLCISMNKNIYNYIGEIYLIQGKFQSAIHYHLKGLQYSKNFENLSGMAWASNDLGKAYHLSGDNQTAKKYLEESIRLFENSNDKLCKAFPLMELSYVYQYNGNVEQTIHILKRSFFLLKQGGYVNDMLGSLNNLGRLYQSQGFLNVAKVIFDFCLTKFEENLSDKQYLGWANNNLARNFLYLNEYDNAIKYFDIALNIFKEINEKLGCIYVLNNIGETYAKQEKYNDALKLLRNTCKQKEKIGDMHGICYSYREIGELYLKLGQLEDAHSYINKATELCKQGNFIMLKGDILTSLGNYYLTVHLPEEAVNAYLEAFDNYKWQNFYSRSLLCAKKINKIILNYSYKNIHPINEDYINHKLTTDEIILIQELQWLLNSLSN